MKISILTATYNREKYLQRLYNSILNNLKFGLDIEWIIIDDGSTDNTERIITNFILEDKIDIKYIFQQNGGKMSAINRGAKLSTGELIVDCDSDDYFAEDAFKIITENVQRLIGDPELYALCFLKKKTSGEISGNKFKKDYMISTMFDLYFKDNIEGEKILVFNSIIRKQFEHELEKNEKFVTEARMYHKMDKKYKIMCINKIIEIGDYMEDGYTKNLSKTFKESPKGYYNYFKEILQMNTKDMLLRKKLYVLKNFFKIGTYLIFLKRGRVPFKIGTHLA